jgi:hypothetical protein
VLLTINYQRLIFDRALSLSPLVRACADRATMAIEHTKEITMALTDLQRALLEAETELGEQAIIKESDGTFTIKNARSGATVLAAGTAAATIKTRVTPIRPAIGKITT